MTWLIDLSQRRREPEVMDDPALDAARHHAALRGLARINRWSGSVRAIWSAIRPLAREHRAGPLRVLDIATGGGDIPIGLWRRARRAGLPLEVAGCDCSARAVEYAQSRAAQTDTPTRFFVLDALRDELPHDYDVLVSALFLHHLDDDQATIFLRRMTTAARRLVVVSDLLRSRAGLVLAFLGTRTLTTSGVVRTDGLRSVRAAFTLAEVRHWATQAGLDGVELARRWPCRFLLTWRRRVAAPAPLFTLAQNR